MTKPILITLLLSAAPALACTCAGYPSPKQAWQESPLVFAGIIEKTHPKTTGPIPAAEQTAWARVTEPFKGVNKDEILVLHERFSSCFAAFPENVPYLFYLFPGEKAGTWHMAGCRRSRALADAVEDLKFLRGLPASARGNTVSGNVILWENDPVKGFRIQRLPAIPVHAIGASHTYDTITGATGAYEFRNLSPGVYNINVDYPKGLTLRFTTAIGRISQAARPASNRDDSTELEVTTDSANGLEFTLAPDTLITGRVLDPGGRPMKGVCLEIESLQARTPRFHLPQPICTNDDGSYMLGKVAPGSFRVVANPDGVITADEPFGRLYYPGTPNPSNANTVTIAEGQHLANIDFHVPKIAPRIELQGRLLFSDGVPVPHQTIDYRPDSGVGQQQTRTSPNGEFLIHVLAGHPGKLTGEIYLLDDFAGACPQFARNVQSSSFSISLKSNPTPVARDKSLSAIDVVFLIPSCRPWLEHVTNLRK